MNDASTRSHCLFIIWVDSTQAGSDVGSRDCSCCCFRRKAPELTFPALQGGTTVQAASGRPSRQRAGRALRKYIWKSSSSSSTSCQ